MRSTTIEALYVLTIIVTGCAWLVFYASGCQPTWAPWVMAGINLYVGYQFGRTGEIRCSTACLLVAILASMFQIYCWAKGWPKKEVEILFWVQVAHMPLAIIDHFTAKAEG